MIEIGGVTMHLEKSLIIKIIIFLVFVLFILMILIDFFRARNMQRPLVCFKEITEEKYNGTYYECTSFGYKFYTFTKEDNSKDYGFRIIFSKDPIAEKYGEQNE